MQNSTIKITFTEDLQIGAQLGFEISNDGGVWGFPSSYSEVFNWVNLRSSDHQVTSGTPTATLGERAAINFVQAFNLDNGRYIVTRSGNEVLISADNTYGLTTFSVNGIFAPYTNDPSLEFEIVDGNSDSFTIDTVTFSNSAIDESQYVIANVTTNQLATKVISPFVLNGNTENPFSFEWWRGETKNLIVENADGIQATQSIVFPSLLNDQNFSLKINNSPNGATVLIENVNTTGLELEYSLDNTVWKTLNAFNGLGVGNYTLYVRDQLGASFEKQFEITEFGIYTPYFYISKSNSFRFANRITFGDSENYKNDENTLSNEAFAKDSTLAYCEIQQFQSADIITTQFKSNYSSNVATIVKSDLSEVNIPVIKKTNNIGIKDKRDARKYNLGNGKTGVFFRSGNTYDYTTGSISGTYLLNGLLPEWAQIGNYIDISGFWLLIEDIVFDETKNAEVLVLTNTYTGPEVSVIAASIFNRFNYEVYEFTIDMVDYIDQYFQVRINNTDDNFPDIIHLSEQIWCKVKHDKVLEIRYSNSTNTDIFYETGIENLIRIPCTFIKGKLDEENEIYKTDTTAILLNAEMYEVDEFIFEPVTKEIWRKITQALSHENVTINGIGYVKNGNFNTEGPLEDSNLYVLTATMMKTGSVYNSQASGSNDFNSTSVEVPRLISTESGYVSY